MHLNDLTNKQFNHWTVIGPYEYRAAKPGSRPRTYWLCQCVCGKKKWIITDNLTRGVSTNCGCLKPRHTESQQRAYAQLSKSTLTHGMTGQRLYRVWQAMKARCQNPKTTRYERYGGRGINLCQQWQQFEPFQNWALANGYTPEMTIERNDVDGNYEPSNCRFVTKREQTRNTSRTIWIQNHSISLSRFCEENAVNYLWVWSALKLKETRPDIWKILQDA
jgi:hypothetical protein